MARTQNNNEVKGASDLYRLMLEVKNGTPSGGKRGMVGFTKKQAATLKIEWSFVENSAKILGLKCERHGKYGYSISL